MTESASPAASGLALACPIDSLGLLEFDGADVRTFLQGQLSSDVEALAPGSGQWSSYNSAKGRVLANFWLWRADEGERHYALAAGDLAAAMQKRLAMFVLRAKVSIANCTPEVAMLGIVGPGARRALEAAFGRAPAAGHVAQYAALPATVVALPDGRFVAVAAATNAPALREALAPHTASGVGSDWDRHSVAAGVPWITAATSDQFVAQMINWDAIGGVSFSKGCYPGQEIVARTRYLGRLKERLFAFHVETLPPPAGARLWSPAFPDQPCGTVVAAAAATGGGADLLAVVQLAAVGAPGLALGAAGGAPLALQPLPYPVPESTAPPRARP